MHGDQQNLTQHRPAPLNVQAGHASTVQGIVIFNRPTCTRMQWSAHVSWQALCGHRDAAPYRNTGELPACRGR